METESPAPEIQNGTSIPSLEYLQSLPDCYGWPRANKRGYRIDETPSGTYRPLKVIVMGAGASGISFAKFSREELQNVEIIIYEKNRDVGGTWLENRYPGCACDVPSVTYQFTWEPDVWSKFYSESPEIHAYMKRVVDKYNLWDFIKLNHTVTDARWEQDSGKWSLTVEDAGRGRTFTETCDIFINAGGPLNYWEWPRIKGIKDFKGVIAHTANYPEDLDLKGKRVAVCGIGSSGIQVTARIQKDVDHLYTWIRSPTWVLGAFANEFVPPGNPNPEYTNEEINLMKNDPVTYLKYRKNIEGSISAGFGVYYKNTPESLAARKIATEDMCKKLESRPDIANALIPKDFPVGCKRPTPGVGFLEALTMPNVTAYPGGDLQQITARGFIDPNGQEQEESAGYVSREPAFVSRVAAPEIPNYFTYYGPYGPLGQASAVVMIEFFTRYFNEFIRKMQVENIKSFAPRIDVALEFQEHADLYLKRTVWDSECRSWWKGGKIDGRIMLYPGSRTQYMELIEHPRYEDYHIEYKAMNRWAFLGNGFSTRDYDGRDITWFWGLVDGKDRQEKYELQWKDVAQPDHQVQNGGKNEPSSEKVVEVAETIIFPNAL
ncbi:hypothetical protein CLAIMM_11945 [Cladophialophora immunda]|nr:hypothetical protein CLAIMM_11945 [Cladophialophora immunda]